MKIKRKIGLLVVLSGLSLVGCYPAESLSLIERDLVITTADSNHVFDNYQTYAMPNTVAKIISGNGTDTIHTSDDTLMLSLVRYNLSELGYTEELDPVNNEPDLLVFIAAQWDGLYRFENGFSFFDWWDSWFNWFSGWGLGSDWQGVSPEYNFTRRLNSGTVYIVMIDPDSFNSSNKTAPIVWSGIINGLIREGSDVTSRIVSGFNTAFIQSPYLKTN